MINTAITTPCSSCGIDTGASWKTLCRSCWKKQTPDEIRAYRQAKIDRKVARLNKWAASREAQADIKTKDFEECRKDWAWVTQPNINTSKGRAFTNSRIKILNRYDAGMRLLNEAQELKEKAEWLAKTGAVVKGDAEAKRQQEREKRDALFTVGSKVYDFCFGDGEIVRVNKKTFTIKFASGSTFARDKSYIEIPRGGEHMKLYIISIYDDFSQHTLVSQWEAKSKEEAIELCKDQYAYELDTDVESIVITDVTEKESN